MMVVGIERVRNLVSHSLLFRWQGVGQTFLMFFRLSSLKWQG